MPVFPADVRLDAGDARGQPVGVSDRDHEVLGALPEQRRDANLGELEAPRLRKGEVVVAPAGDALGEGALEALLRMLRALAREDGRVDRRKDRAPDLPDLIR